MRKRIAYIMAAGALLLVGAGCGGAVKEDASADINANEEGEESMIKADEGAEVKVEGSVEGAVDEIIDGAEEEEMNEVESESEKDADEVTSDKAGVNAYMESNYEIK